MKTYLIVLPNGDRIILDAEDLEHLIYEGTIQVNMYEEQKRIALEMSHGKDKDKPYEFKPPSEWLPKKGLSALLHTLGRVTRGEVGGKDDGEDDQ